MINIALEVVCQECGRPLDSKVNTVDDGRNIIREFQCVVCEKGIENRGYDAARMEIEREDGESEKW